MLEATQKRGGDDAPVPLWRARPGWRMEVAGPLGPRRVVIGDELLDDPLQVPRVERHAVIHALASERPDPALGHGIRVRSPHRCHDRLNSKPRRPGHAVVPVGAVAVSDQIARAMVPGRGLDQLLPGPGRRGMGRAVDVLDAAARLRDDEEDVHRPERERRYGTDVRRPDDAARVVEEGPPARRRRPPHGLPPVAADRLRTHVGTERPQRGPDAHRAPARILPRQAENQVPRLDRDPPPPRPGRATLPGPEPAPAGAMPTPDRVRMADHQGRAPARPATEEVRPEQTSDRGHARAALAQHQVLAQGAVLEEKILPRASDASQPAGSVRSQGAGTNRARRSPPRRPLCGLHLRDGSYILDSLSTMRHGARWKTSGGDSIVVGIFLSALWMHGGFMLGAAVAWAWAVGASINHGLIAGGIGGGLLTAFITLVIVSGASQARQSYEYARASFVGSTLLILPVILIGAVGALVGLGTHL